MSASARLYERLQQIPTDPEDPESLEDVVVCAFGAFERYYVCWRTRGGAYRQDSHDLPPDLRDFLFDQSDARDFASLQVVFGRGDEFFASDKNGKLEYKEPEPEKKEPTPEELVEKRALRRSRTISFLRPRSDDSQKSSLLDLDSPSSSRRSSLINGRPPSMSLSFRSNSDASLNSLSSQSDPRQSNGSRFNSDSSAGSLLWSATSSNPTTIPSTPSSETEIKLDNETVEDEKSTAPPPVPSSNQSTRRLRPLSMSFKAGLIQRIPEGKQVPAPEASSPPPPLPPVPSLSRMPTLPVGTSAGLWVAKPTTTPPRPAQDEGLAWQPRQRSVDQAPTTRSSSPPFQLPEQSDSPIETKVESLERTEPSPEGTRAASQLSQPPMTSTSAELNIQLHSTAAATSPTSPAPGTHAKEPSSQTALSLQIISTAAATAPISPRPDPTPPTPQLTLSIQLSAVSTEPTQPTPPPRPTLTLQLSSLSTSPISPPAQRPAALTTQHPSSKPTTSTTSTQTSPPVSPLRTALRIDTGVAAPAFPRHSYSFSTTSSALDIETPDDYYEPPPVFMGRMMDYYSKPGYQLGASLFGGYTGPMYEEVVVEGELTEWERANGRGY